MENFESMTLEQLKQLKTEIGNEILKREPRDDMVVYVHDCAESSNHHKNKYKHWSKLVTGVDTSRADGYAFAGEFLTFGREHMVPKNSIVIDVCDDQIYAYEMDGAENICFAQSDKRRMAEFIKTVKLRLEKA